MAKKSNYQWFELTVFTNQTKYKIISTTCKNYNEIKNELVKGKRNKTESEEKKKNFHNYYALMAFIFGSLIFFAAYHLNIPKEAKVTSEQLTSIEGTITAKPEIDVSGKGHRSIHFELSQYPNFHFKISGVSYSATYAEDFVSSVNTRDTVSIDIFTDEYKKKLTREEEMSFLDKSVNYRFISIYGLRAKNTIFLSLEDYNYEKKSDEKLGVWILVLLGMFFIGLSLYQFKLFRQQNEENDSKYL